MCSFSDGFEYNSSCLTFVACFRFFLFQSNTTPKGLYVSPSKTMVLSEALATLKSSTTSDGLGWCDLLWEWRFSEVCYAPHWDISIIWVPCLRPILACPSANGAVAGPVGGFGWRLKLNQGAPHTTKINLVEALPSTPIGHRDSIPSGNELHHNNLCEGSIHI